MVTSRIAFVVLCLLYVAAAASVGEKRVAAWVAVVAGTAISGLGTGVLIMAFKELFINN